MTGKAVTANRLGDGTVVYLTDDGQWSTRVGDCLVSGAADGERMMDRAAEAEPAQHVVGAYLIDVEVADGAVHPLTLREAIRAKGPTVGNAAGGDAAGGSTGNGNGVSLR